MTDDAFEDVVRDPARQMHAQLNSSLRTIMTDLNRRVDEHIAMPPDDRRRSDKLVQIRGLVKRLDDTLAEIQRLLPWDKKP